MRTFYISPKESSAISNPHPLILTTIYWLHPLSPYSGFI